MSSWRLARRQKWRYIIDIQAIHVGKFRNCFAAGFKRPAQGFLMAGSEVGAALLESGRRTGAALGLANSATGEAVGAALKRSARGVARFLNRGASGARR